MCGGGGSTPAPDPEAEYRARRAYEAEKRAAEQAQLEQERARTQQIYTQNSQRHADAFKPFSETTRSYYDNKLGQYTLGDDASTRYLLDDMNFDLKRRLRDVNKAVPISNSDPNASFDFSSYNPNKIVDELFDTYTGQWQNIQGDSLDTLFNPNFETNLFSDTSDDAIINNILNEQYLDAETKLKSSLDRGQLNQSGYDFALRNLGNQKTSATSKLQQLGGDVLSGYRRDLTGVRDKAFQERDSLDFGQNLADYSSILDSAVNERRGRKEGDIRGALGNEKLFNIGDLINRAGGYQGATNIDPSKLKVQSALPGQPVNDDDEESAYKGAGSTGTF